MPLILATGYEDAVRAKFGVKATELPNEDINHRMILDLAESLVIKRVPDYASITDTVEKLYLEAAVIAQICYQLCPGMARRLNSSVQTIDVTWKKDKIDWLARAAEYNAEFERALQNITSVAVSTGYDSKLLGIVKGPSTQSTGG